MQRLYRYLTELQGLALDEQSRLWNQARQQADYVHSIRVWVAIFAPLLVWLGARHVLGPWIAIVFLVASSIGFITYALFGLTRTALRKVLLRSYAGRRLPACWNCGYCLRHSSNDLPSCPECGNRQVFAPLISCDELSCKPVSRDQLSSGEGSSEN